MLLNERQLREIARIIADHHSAFVVNRIGPNAVAPDTLERLKALGLVNVQTRGVEDAYLYGMVAAALPPGAKKMTLREFRQYVRRNPVPMTAVETQAVKMAQAREAKYVVGLGNRIDTSTGALMIEADAQQRQALRTTITRQVEANVAARESVKQLKSDLGWAMDDWTRDLDRIAVTEKAAAMAEGTSAALTEKYGEDVPVSILTANNCCPACQRLYCGGDGAPKLFRLSTLVANGTNVGRRAAQWLPTRPPIHPHCSCTLVRVPPGYGYDAQNQLVPGGTFGQHHDAEVAKASPLGGAPPAPARPRRPNLARPGAAGRPRAQARVAPAARAQRLERPERPALRMRADEPLRKAAAPRRAAPLAKSVPIAVPDRNSGRPRGLVGAALLFNPPPLPPPKTAFVGSPLPVREVERDKGGPAWASFKRDIADYEMDDAGRARKVRPVTPPDIEGATRQSAQERKRAIAARRRMLARMAQIDVPVDAVRSVLKVGR